MNLYEFQECIRIHKNSYEFHDFLSPAPPTFPAEHPTNIDSELLRWVVRGVPIGIARDSLGVAADSLGITTKYQNSYGISDDSLRIRFRSL